MSCKTLRVWSFFMHPDTCVTHSFTSAARYYSHRSPYFHLCKVMWIMKTMTGISKMCIWLSFHCLSQNASRSSSRDACHSTTCQGFWKGTDISRFLFLGSSFLNCTKEWRGYRAISTSFPSFGLQWLPFIFKMLPIVNTKEHKIYIAVINTVNKETSWNPMSWAFCHLSTYIMHRTHPQP